MSDRPALWFPLILLAALAALTTWLDFEVRSNLTEAANRDRHDPDTILHDFSTRQTGKTGALEVTVKAKTLRHFMDDGSTEMEAPQVEHRDAKGNTLSVHSDRGRSSGDRKTLEFEGRVTLRQGGATKSPATLETSYLKLLPDRRLASTDRDVRIQSAGTLITGHGLDFDMDARTLKLRSRVKVTYQPASQHAAKVPASASRRPDRRAAGRRSA
ncbi:MAG: LPS export ABC transporter periplasmic protein LptC [Betaproteobacteria bacterium]|nr:LPS export ABC transporter periplasmic protein LptC [Betaproteobacteria bacterium]